MGVGEQGSGTGREIGELKVPEVQGKSEAEFNTEFRVDDIYAEFGSM